MKKSLLKIFSTWVGQQAIRKLSIEKISVLIGIILTVGLNGLASAQSVISIVADADAYIESGQKDVNFGASPTLLVRQTNSTTNLSRASYINFRLASLPAIPIVSAKLRLYGRHETPGTGIPVAIRPSTGATAWSESVLTWSNAYQLAPVDYSSTPIAITTVTGDAAKYYEWDVTAFINSRRTAGFATLSAYTSVLSQYRVSFDSKEAVNKPQLILTMATTTWTPACPNNYDPVPGVNRDFPTPSGMRAFSLDLPANATTAPHPVWMPLTSAVESTNENLDSRGGNRKLINNGYIVIGPIRRCAGQDPHGAGTSVNGGSCNTSGTGGWTWNPWNEGRVFGVVGDLWKTAEGPDSLFLEAIVKCVATKYPVDQRRVFLGGIDSGATMTNRALLFRSDFWAGGMPISGEWYVTRDDGTAWGTNEFTVRVAAVAANPTKIFQGRVGPLPLKTSLDPLIVLTVWGGPNDRWTCGGIECMNFRQSTQVGSNYFSSMSNVVHVACSASHGHQWPTTNRDAFNLWALTTLSSHPKGTSKSAFVLTTPPSGYSCVVGRYTDHYPGT